MEDRLENGRKFRTLNIIDDYDVPKSTPPRIDYAVRIEGPLINNISANVHNLWRRIAWAHIYHRLR